MALMAGLSAAAGPTRSVTPNRATDKRLSRAITFFLRFNDLECSFARPRIACVGSFRRRPRSANPQPSIRDNHPQAGGRDSRAQAADDARLAIVQRVSRRLFAEMYGF